MQPLSELIETVLYTACVAKEKPVSIIIVGPSGVGKSVLISRYKSVNLMPTDSVTSMGLFNIAQSDPKNEIKFLQIPDLNPTLSRKPTTVQATMANLLSFTADGTVRTDDGRSNKESKHNAVGMVTSATDDIYHGQAKKWFALGLRRRIIPVFFKYSTVTTGKLQRLVKRDKIQSTNPETVTINLTKSFRPKIPRKLAGEIEFLSNYFAKSLGKLSKIENSQKKWFVRNVLPIAPQITLQNLARAHAIRAKRNTVNRTDIQFLKNFIEFSDPETPREL